MRPGVLAELVARDLRRFPIDRGGIERRRLPIGHDLEVLGGEIVGILPDLGDEILLRHDLGHAPGRKEIDLDDLGRNLRRRARGLAGDDVALESERATLDGLGEEGRDVDEHVARRLVDAHQTFEALEIGLELGQALLRRDVKRGQGSLIDKA